MNAAARTCCLLMLLWVEIQPPPPGAAIDPKLFRYARTIPQSPAGWSDVVLDAAVLAHSRQDLADLRIADSSDHQIAYLLQKSHDPLGLNLQLLPDKTSAVSHQSRYTLILPFENLPAASLVLTTSERAFHRMVWVERKRPDSEVERIAAGPWSHKDPESAAPPLRLDLPPSLRTTALAVVVDEGDNHPLSLNPAHLELPLYRLRFHYPADGKLRLLYGQEALSAPRYDLELLAPRLADVSSREITLDPENVTPALIERNALQTRLFWGAVVLAAAVVLTLLVRLLRKV
jgi:hypothetical protein